MPFHRFEEYESSRLAPHLSSARAPVIEGRYMYFCMVSKEAGTGSELHYHPNELLIFPVEGKLNAIVGKDRRIVSPGTFVHAPAYARHSMKATEDGPLRYLYIKDLTWSVVGLAEDEAVPDKPMSVEEANRLHDAGEADTQRAEGESQAIVHGLPNCYYPIIDSLDAPPCSARREVWTDGERLGFGFFELPPYHTVAPRETVHEEFMYVLRGELNARVGEESRWLARDGIVECPRGSSIRLRTGDKSVRYVVVRSLPYLEKRIDAS